MFLIYHMYVIFVESPYQSWIDYRGFIGTPKETPEFIREMNWEKNYFKR